MNKQEFLVLAKAMRAVYQRDNFLTSEDAMTIWYEMLSDIPYAEANIAVQKYMLTSKFPPTIADIREMAAQVSQPADHDSGEAWRRVMNAVRRFGYYDQQGALESLDPVTREAAERFGFRELCDCRADEVGVARGQFMKIYDQIVRRKQEDALLPIGMNGEIARLRQKTVEMLESKL